VSESLETPSFHVECPHCHKQFDATPMPGRAARYHGFKCPHCRLFVPYQRAADRELLEPLGSDTDS
jgi:hypothetical protein